MKMKKDNPMKIAVLNCSICKAKIDEQVIKNTKQVYWTEGHNAEPVNSGRCCSYCNDNVVVPVRMLQAFDSELDDINVCLKKALKSIKDCDDIGSEFYDVLDECLEVSKGALETLSNFKLEEM
jgi:hypothetical protein